jgi:hypothetical protein
MEPDEVVLRTFAKVAEQADIAVVDEGAEPTKSLKGGALRFDEDGCSVSRDAILSAANVSRSALLSPPKYTWIASSTKAEIEGHVQRDAAGDEYAPFVVVPDPFPAGFEEPKDASHALIQMARDYSSNTKKRLSIDTLAKQVFTAPQPIEPPEEDEVDPSHE